MVTEPPRCPAVTGEGVQKFLLSVKWGGKRCVGRKDVPSRKGPENVHFVFPSLHKHLGPAVGFSCL